MNDDFYIGHQPHASRRTGRRMRALASGLCAFGALVGVLLALGQNRFPPKSFEWGSPTQHEGWIELMPHPVLVVDAPGRNADPSRYLLVAPGKFGAREMVRAYEFQHVRVSGSLIYRDDQTMLELVPGSIVLLEDGSLRAEPQESAGAVTLRGEIVDSKCFLGVMAPGSTKPHRACAVRCISGGIPPVLLIRDRDGDARYVLLAGSDGRMVNRELLPYIAEPIELSGELLRQSDLWLLRADLSTLRRLHQDDRTPE